MNDIDDLLSVPPEAVADDGFTLSVMNRLPPPPPRAGREYWWLAGWAAASLAMLILIVAGQNGDAALTSAGASILDGAAVMFVAPILTGFMAWVLAGDV
ncbi:MAG: hypothetical protein AAF205_08030 [Pseudomonadota bacterium]